MTTAIECMAKVCNRVDLSMPSPGTRPSPLDCPPMGECGTAAGSQSQEVLGPGSRVETRSLMLTVNLVQARSITNQVTLQPRTSQRLISHCERAGESREHLTRGGPRRADTGLGLLACYPHERACSFSLLFRSFTSLFFFTSSPSICSKYAPGAIQKIWFSLA